MTRKLSDAEILAISEVIELVSSTFPFGYYDIDDIKQECWCFALEAMPRYDAERPLRNFIYTHLWYRLLNLWRNKYRRTDPPCIQCFEAHTMGLPAPHGGDFCRRYKSWFRRNAAKRSLASPGDLSRVEDSDHPTYGGSPEIEAQAADLLQLINRKLPELHRETFDAMASGIPVGFTHENALAEELRYLTTGGVCAQ